MGVSGAACATVAAQAFSGIGGIDDLEKKWHDMQKEYGA